MFGFARRRLEEMYEMDIVQKHAGSEEKTSKLLAVIEWVFWVLTVKKRHVMAPGAWLQLGLVAMPNTLFAIECWRSGDEMNGRRRRIMRMILKFAYLPVCLIIAPYRNAEPADHPFHLLEDERWWMRALVAVVYMPLGAFLAPGILSTFFVLFLFPMKFSNHTKCIAINTVFCLVIHTSFTAELLMISNSSREWVLGAVGALDKFANISLAIMTTGSANLEFPIFFPCHLWWIFLSIYFQGFLSWSLLWFRELKARELFLAEQLESEENQFQVEDIITERLVPAKVVFDVLNGPWVWFLFLALQIVSAAIIWKLSVWSLWALGSNGLFSYFEKYESWKEYHWSWLEDGML